MDEQLAMDSSGAWVRKTAQLIAEKPLSPPEHFGGLHCAADHSFDFTSDQREDIYTVPLD
jgi:hypothetical protein